MTSRRLALLLPTCLLGGGLVVVACGDDAKPATPTTDAGRRRSTSSSSGESSGSSGEPDGGSGVSTSEDPVEIDGGGPCGAYDFGKPAAPFGPVDTSDNTYDGGVLAPGIYDAVHAERGSDAGGSWRETFAVDANGQYTRIRQIDVGGGPGVVRYRSGKVTTDSAAAQITLKEECAFNDGNFADAGSDTVPYEVREGAATDYLYGLSGFRITLQKR